VGNRLPNPRLVKVHRSYAVEETARLLRVHKNTVRNWLKQGLALIDAIRGELEIAFTQPRPRLGERAAPSVNCDSGEKAQAHENA
jgi:hypothetical protein